MRYVPHPRQSDRLLRKFLCENHEAIQREFDLYINSRGVKNSQIEVRFYKRPSPSSCAMLVSNEVTDYCKVINFNFSAQVVNEYYYQTILLVEVE